ncbi:MAG TPA: hypothetical protein DHW02_19945 [Ktedonobacter sp.]|nr:hypothetical protein [Ktedonobacter sp.]
MNTDIHYIIKFKQGDFAHVRARLLDDLSREHFAVLLGKTHKIDGYTIITVVDMLVPAQADYEYQSATSLHIKKEFILRVLTEMNSRYDVDTIIDVHTHPFLRGSVAFSATDDEDERTFFQFLKATFEGVKYASIVFSQDSYSARVWTLSNGFITARKALLKTQTKTESIASSDFREYTEAEKQYEKKAVASVESFFNRGALALGLDVMRHIMHNQVISIIGVGGLGSVVAEHLIHMGFHDLNLIDPDVLEISNMNRIVGAYYRDAQRKLAKVEVVKKHLTNINPHATVHAYKKDVHDGEMESVLALSDWLIVATDNHSSRLRAQELSVQYYVPLLSVGVNISVQDNAIQDMSGEVITARVGDYLCLSCLHRINPTKVASEKHPDVIIRTELVRRGYVTGQDVKEPAVKTLNTFLATMAVDTLIAQYTDETRSVPILVYENNGSMRVYEDSDSVERRNKHCFLCNV